MNNQFDSAASLREARSRFPFERILQEYGHAPQNGKFRSFTCPHCRKKSKAGLFKAGDAQLFKCFSTSCPTGAESMDEVAYIAYTGGISRADAFVNYLKMAGVWRERHRITPPMFQPTLTPAAEPAVIPTEFPAPEIEPASHTTHSESSTASIPVEAPPVTTSSAIDNAMADEASLSDVPEDTLPGNEEASDEVIAEMTGDDQTAPTETAAENVEGGLDAMRWFYEQTALAAHDDQSLLDKRGLGTSAIVALGFRSNSRDNLRHLVAMAEHFPPLALLESGLWHGNDGDAPSPNKQFYGYGRIGKNEDGTEKWGWSQPILIPYFDENGALTHLRPHKGGIKGHPPRLYIPRVAGQKDEGRKRLAIITEGEFKAAALWQIFRGTDTGIAAIPGVQMANNYNCQQELEEWLARIRPSRVVVVYDNEEKGDPALPGYKAIREKRYDAMIWARILAEDITEKLKIPHAVWNLPKEWRDSTGKADWDGALASFLKLKMHVEPQA